VGPDHPCSDHGRLFLWGLALLIPIGLLVSGHESGILEGACHEDLALLISGSLVASGVAAAYFWVNFDFAQRRERHVHRNHVVRAVSLIEVNG
jgi:hypothetical protein